MGFGASVLAQLIKTKIKRNLYYEIKDRVFEERVQGMTLQKMTKKVKVYGYDETKQSRELLMSILRDRMDNHKAKFISPIIYNELCTLEVKKNGRIEHTSNAHDDQVFSYLLALYIWYEGKDLMERYGLQKSNLTTDDDFESEMGITENYEDLTPEMANDDDQLKQEIKEFFDSNKSMSHEQWLQIQQKENAMADNMLRNDPRTREAWAKHNFMSKEDLGGPNMLYTIPDSVFDLGFGEEKAPSKLQRDFDTITDIR